MSQRRRVPLEERLLRLSLLSGLPGVAVALGVMIAGDFTAKVRWTFGILAVGVWLGASFAAREVVVRRLQLISNLIAALREGDYSVRGRQATRDDAFGEVLVELAGLREALRSQRLGELEAGWLAGARRRTSLCGNQPFSTIQATRG